MTCFLVLLQSQNSHKCIITLVTFTPHITQKPQVDKERKRKSRRFFVTYNLSYVISCVACVCDLSLFDKEECRLWLNCSIYFDASPPSGLCLLATSLLPAIRSDLCYLASSKSIWFVLASASSNQIRQRIVLLSNLELVVQVRPSSSQDMFLVCLAKHVLTDAEKLSVRNNYQIMDWWLCLLMKERCLTDGGSDLA